eukprot:TRINITY_DN6710_c0_g2_i2.p1 TRINITY_DN6710_c0_g2~~TRINITY_DN6710_c0_g2_i2.p1  ORF type:complete len:825 (+),score=115.72 TRINITY_DN6710_c0_g2_i2:94-2475(+)
MAGAAPPGGGDDLIRWLRGNALAHLIEVFQQQDIVNLDEAFGLTEEELIEMGISAADRSAFFGAVSSRATGAPSEVDQWLESLGYGQHAGVFQKNEIFTLQEVRELDDGDLKEMFQAIGTRKRIASAVQKLKADAVSAGGPGPVTSPAPAIPEPPCDVPRAVHTSAPTPPPDVKQERPAPDVKQERPAAAKYVAPSAGARSSLQRGVAERVHRAAPQGDQGSAQQQPQRERWGAPQGGKGKGGWNGDGKGGRGRAVGKDDERGRGKGWALGGGKGGNGGEGGTDCLPSAKATKICWDWLRGDCTYGAACRFAHRKDEPVMPQAAASARAWRRPCETQPCPTSCPPAPSQGRPAAGSSHGDPSPAVDRCSPKAEHFRDAFFDSARADSHTCSSGFLKDRWPTAAPKQRWPRAPCSFYLQGQCLRGTTCEFAHEYPEQRSPSTARSLPAAAPAAPTLERLRERETELLATRARLAAKEEELSTEHKKVEEMKSSSRLVVIERIRQAHDMPMHWTEPASHAQGWQAVSIPDSTAEFDAFRECLLSTRSNYLGRGRDTSARSPYEKLVLKRAWRIESPIQWKQYSIAREAVAVAVEHRRLNRKELRLRQATADTLGPKGTALPDALHSGGGVNEVRLFHGTRQDALLSLLSDGLNERFSGTSAGTRFGQGLYFAEDPGKSDQYAVAHAPGTAPELERRLYRDGNTQPGSVYYVLVCRVVCGDYAVTRDGTSLDPTAHPTGGSLWATSDRRELARSTAGDRHTSLLAERGEKLLRYREFVLFHGQRAYPEYLLAYTRE